MNVNEHHPQLFEKVADHILQLPGLGKFKPQELAITWYGRTLPQMRATIN